MNGICLGVMVSKCRFFQTITYNPVNFYLAIGNLTDFRSKLATNLAPNLLVVFVE